MNPELPKSELETPDAEQFLTSRRFALVLAVLLAVTFGGVLFGGEAFFYRDYGFLGYPFVAYHRECFWNGELPLWNPFIHCGVPFLAQWNTTVLYPGALIYLLLPLPWSLGFFCVAHLFLGGMGMRALAERWTGSRFGAAVAGVSFGFSGLVLGCLVFPNYLVALGWMPWVVLATRRAWLEGGRRILLAALAGAMQMLSGAPEIILLTWGVLLVMVCLAWLRGFPDAPPDTPVRQRLADFPATWLGRFMPPGYSREVPAKDDQRGHGIGFHAMPLRFLGVVGLIAGLCAIQLLPFLDLLASSQRSGTAADSFWSLPGWGWVNLFFPLFMNFQTDQGVFVMIGQSFFPSVYLGIVPLTLAQLAVWRVRTPEVRVLAAATMLAVLLAFGANFVLWGWLAEVLPIGYVRFPVKALLLAAFTVPLLAAWGARLCAGEIPSSTASPGRMVFSSFTCLASVLISIGLLLACYHADLLKGLFPSKDSVARFRSFVELKQAGSANMLVRLLVLFLMTAWLGFWLRSRRRAWLFQLGVIGLLWADVESHTPRFNPTIPTAAFDLGLASAYHASKGALTPAPKLGESRVMLSPQAERALHTRMVPKFYDDFIGQRLALWGNLNLLDAVPKVNGAATLRPAWWNDVEYALYGTTNAPPDALADFLGVAHVTRPGELLLWERRTNSMPLVTAGQRVEFVEPGAASLTAIRERRWNPREVVFLPASARDAQPSSDRTHAMVRVTRFSAECVELEVEAGAATVVVIAQTFHPNWQAVVNGQRSRIWRANHAFQAVPVPAGISTIRLRYRERWFERGAVLSGLTALICVVSWRRWKIAGPQPADRRHERSPSGAP